MSFLAERFPTLARHIGVLRESWQRQNEADKDHKPGEEHEFLPAALEIMDKPPSPGLRWLMLAICTLLVLALIWSVFGRIDVVAVASGKTVPSGNVKVVQPIEIGAVRAIHVTNGQFVKAGDLLIELDPTLASADEAQSEQALLSARIIQARNDALMGYLRGGSGSLDLPDGTPTDTRLVEQAFVQNAIAQYEAQRGSLLQQRAESEAEFTAASAEIAKLREALPYIEEQLIARAELAERGFYSRLRVLEYEQLRAEHLRNIDVQEAQRTRAAASIERINSDLRSLRATFGKTAVTDLAEAQSQASMAEEELRKAERRRQYQELRAPVDGVVQQLTVTTVGGVVQPAQALMVIVPCDVDDESGLTTCNSGVMVEAYIQNKDIGFVEVGQRVAIKLEAFNFTDHGLLEGEVENLSRDAIDQSRQPPGDGRDEEGRPVPTGLVYAAKISLPCGGSEVARSPLCDSVQPGMAVQAEVKTGKRRIIQYLLSPISKALDEAGRER